MIFVPESSQQVLNGTPVHGSPELIDAISSLAESVLYESVVYRGLVQTAAQNLAHTSSEATEKVIQWVNEVLVSGALLVHNSSRDASSALDLFSAHIADIHDQAVQLREVVDEALTAIHRHSASIAAIHAQAHSAVARNVAYVWSIAPPLLMPEYISSDLTNETQSDVVPGLIGSQLQRMRWESEWLTAASGWRDALERIEYAKRQWQELIEERVGVETQLKNGLQGTAAGQLNSVHLSLGMPAPESLAQIVAGDLSVLPRFQPETTHAFLNELIGRGDGFDIFEQSVSPQRVAEQWTALTVQQQEELIEHTPWVIGNLAGLPFAVRHRANLITLRHYVARQTDLGIKSQIALGELTDILQQQEPGDPPVSVVALDLHRSVPFVSVGYGDLDTATSITWQVPGMYSDADQALGTWHEASQNLHAAQSHLLQITDRDLDTSALVVFMQYDAPELLSVLSSERARVGAERLATELDGVVATRSQNTPLVTQGVLAHSYGTNVASLALLRIERPADFFVMVASAGLDRSEIGELTDLRVTRDFSGVPNVFTTMAEAEMIAAFGTNISGRLHPNEGTAWNPERELSGIYAYSSDGTAELRATLGHGVIRSDGHGYFDAGTQSLENAAALTTGMLERVKGGLHITTNSRLSAPLGALEYVQEHTH